MNLNDSFRLPAKNIEQVSQRLFSIYHLNVNAIGALVISLLLHVRWKVTNNFDEPLLRYNAELPQDVIAALNVFKKFVWKYVIRHVETQRIGICAVNVFSRNVPDFARTPNVYCQRIPLIVGEMHRSRVKTHYL